jgi:MFS family permease
MNPWRGLKNLPRNLWMLFFTMLINRIGTMVLPFLALYLTQKVGVSLTKAGLVLTFYGIGALLTSPFLGKISDKFGALKIMKISLIGSSIFLFFFPFINGFTNILIYTFAWSVINEAFRPALLSLVSEVVSSEQRRSAYAVIRLAANLGMSIGPVIGGLLVIVNFNLIFIVDGITTLLAGIFLIISPWQYKPIISNSINSDSDVAEIKKIENIFADRRLIYFLIALLPIPLIYFQTNVSMPLYLVRNLHFSETVYGVVFTINTVLIILVEVPLTNMLNHWSDRKMLSIGALLCGIGFGSMAFIKDIYGLVITIIIWTFGEMIFFPSSSAYMSEISPENRRGEYMGAYQTTFNLAFAFGPWFGTAVMSHFGSSTLWIATFLLGLIASIMMLKIKSISISQSLGKN